MESERPAHAEYQQSGSRSVRLKNHQVSFTTSSFRLQKASKPQYTALLERQALKLDRAGTTGAGPSQRIGAGSFSLLDDSSSGRMPSTARQPGLMMSSAAERKTGSRHEIGIRYVTSEGADSKGVVPLITVGSVFTLFNRRCVHSQMLGQTCSQPLSTVHRSPQGSTPPCRTSAAASRQLQHGHLGASHAQPERSFELLYGKKDRRALLRASYMPHMANCHYCRACRLMQSDTSPLQRCFFCAGSCSLILANLRLTCCCKRWSTKRRPASGGCSRTCT